MGDKQKEKTKKKKDGLMPDAAYTVNPDDVEIGDDLSILELLKKKKKVKNENEEEK